MKKILVVCIMLFMITGCGNSEIKDVVIKEFMYPGMPDFNKNITILNSKAQNDSFICGYRTMYFLYKIGMKFMVTLDDVIQIYNNENFGDEFQFFVEMIRFAYCLDTIDVNLKRIKELFDTVDNI